MDGTDDTDGTDGTDGGLILRAPAKITLSLAVLGRRPDGYHALRSVMQTLELHDILELYPDPAGDITLACDEPALAGESNLAWRAATLLRVNIGYSGGARLVLRKRIPIDAGLGGGSSDAATALIGLNKLWGLDAPPSRLAELGARLGSDVPFFFHTPTALATGRGETVVSLPPLPRVHAVLCKPDTGVSTRQVFAALTPELYSDGSQTEALLAALRAGWPPSSWPLSNDLQRTTLLLYPAVARALDALRDAGAPNALMTGSGSTCYALFADEEDARRTHRRLAGAGIWTSLTSTSTAAPR